MNRHNRLAESFSHECLQLVLDLWLLLLQVVWMENWSSCLLQFHLLVSHVLDNSRAYCSRFVLILDDIVAKRKIWAYVWLLSDCPRHSRVLIHKGLHYSWPAPDSEAESHIATTVYRLLLLAIRSCASSLYTWCALVVLMICVAERPTAHFVLASQSLLLNAVSGA